MRSCYANVNFLREMSHHDQRLDDACQNIMNAFLVFKSLGEGREILQVSPARKPLLEESTVLKIHLFDDHLFRTANRHKRSKRCN